MPTQVLLKGAMLACDDRIVLGEGLFETLKVANSQPSHALLHWKRLSDSANQLGICFDLSFDDWQTHLNTQINQDQLVDGGIKVVLTGGSAPRGLVERGDVSQLFFQSFQYSLSDKPLRLLSASWLRDEVNPVYQVKSVNYLEAILARREALAQGVDDALFFNLNRHATETTCANFFIIKNDALFTPKVADGVLPGITRSCLFSICAENQISCNEFSLTRAMIEAADAVFITNCLQGIRGVVSLDGVQFPEGHLLMDFLRKQFI